MSKPQIKQENPNVRITRIQHRAYKLTSIFFFVLLSVTIIGCDNTKGDLQLVKQNPDKGFNFPYYLFIPKEGLNSTKNTLIVEPNNTGSPTDDFDKHISEAKQQARSSQIGNFLSHKLNYPLLIPVFPRPDSIWQTYTHALDRDALLQKGNSIERLDLQLIAMYEDAKKKLNDMGYEIENKFIMSGFSACGTFTNRFAAIHPERVKSYIVGGVNGMLILPEGKINGKSIPYPIGIDDLDSITGKQFDIYNFKKIPQFLFMGNDDDNDAAKYQDAYDDSEREIIYELLGTKMIPDRWNFCTELYQKHNINATIRLYKNTGHEITDEIQKDVLSFIKKISPNEGN